MSIDRKPGARRPTLPERAAPAPAEPPCKTYINRAGLGFERVLSVWDRKLPCNTSTRNSNDYKTMRRPLERFDFVRMQNSSGDPAGLKAKLRDDLRRADGEQRSILPPPRVFVA
jgi:hypothetical protein